MAVARGASTYRTRRHSSASTPVRVLSPAEPIWPKLIPVGSEYVSEPRQDSNDGTLGSVRRLLLASLVVVVVVQQFPGVSRSYYDAFRTLLYVGFALLAILSLIRPGVPRLPVMLRSALLAAVVTATFVIAAGLRAELLSPVREFMVAMAMVWISWMNPVSPRFLRRWLIILGVLISAVALAVIDDAGGLVISVIYVVDHKNQVGPLLGSAALLSLGIAWSLLADRRRNWALICLTFVNASIALLGLTVSRNRTGLLGVAAVASLSLGLSFIQRPRSRFTILFIALGVVTLVLLFPSELGSVGTFLWDSVTLSRDVTDIDSLSSDRFDGYGEALDFLRGNWAFGMLSEDHAFQQTPHNWVLHKLSLYGAVGGAAILFFYGRLWIWGFKSQGTQYRDSSVVSWNLVGRLLLFGLFCSLFEYSQPFGPGVSGILLWTMLGQALAQGGPAPQGISKIDNSSSSSVCL